MDWIGRGTTESLACQKDMKMMPDKVTYQENIGFSNARDHLYVFFLMNQLSHLHEKWTIGLTLL